jgi:hypothetical protein
MEFVEAKVIDGSHLKLLQRINVPPGSRVMISVMPIDDMADENEAWPQMAAESLAAAYGEEEPDYSAKFIRQHNPEFQP